MSWLKDAWNTAVNYTQDSIKWSIAPATRSYGSITGYYPDMEYQTQLGKTIGGTISGSTDAVHNILKSFVNGFTGGLATQFTNSWRPAGSKEGDGSSLFDWTGTGLTNPSLSYDGTDLSFLLDGSEKIQASNKKSSLNLFVLLITILLAYFTLNKKKK